MELNLGNVEELVFFDKAARAAVPECRHLFDQWELSQRVPGLRPLGRRSVIDFLNGLTGDRLAKLQEYFGRIIEVDRVDPRLAASAEFALADPTPPLCEFTGYREFCLTRDGDRVRATFWR